MKNTSIAIHLIQSFAYEGLRAFFRPKLNEGLQVPRFSNEEVDMRALEEEELRRSPNAYFYLGLGIEMLVATLLFVALIAISFFAQTLMENVVVYYANPPKWEPVIQLFSAGSSLVSLALFFVFSLKIFQALIHRLVNHDD